MECYRFCKSDLEPKSKVCYNPTDLFNSFRIRLKLEQPTVMLDSSCAELAEQKHHRTVTQNKETTLDVWLNSHTVQFY